MEQSDCIYLGDERRVRAFRVLPAASEQQMLGEAFALPDGKQPDCGQLKLKVARLRLFWLWVTAARQSNFAPIDRFSRLYADTARDEAWWKEKGDPFWSEVGPNLLWPTEAGWLSVLAEVESAVRRLYPKEAEELWKEFCDRLESSHPTWRSDASEVDTPLRVLLQQLLFHLSADYQTGLLVKGGRGLASKVHQAIVAGRERLGRACIYPVCAELRSYDEWRKLRRELVKHVKQVRALRHGVPMVLLEDNAHKSSRFSRVNRDEFEPRDKLAETAHRINSDINLRFIGKNVPVVCFIEDQDFAFYSRECDHPRWKVLAAPFPTTYAQAVPEIRFPSVPNDAIVPTRPTS